MRTKRMYPRYESGSALLNEAFKDLRKNGFVARQNFSCCQSCAWAELEDVKNKPKVGYVFYHRQDGDSLKKTGHCCIAFDSVGTITTKEVGAIIERTLLKHGITTRWDGNPDTRVEVFLP